MSFRGSRGLCFCLLLALLLLQHSSSPCWGRHTVSLGIVPLPAMVGQKDSNILRVAEYEDEWMVEGRSLKVRLNDYGDPSANPVHDPPTPAKKVGNGNRGGRKG